MTKAPPISLHKTWPGDIEPSCPGPRTGNQEPSAKSLGTIGP